MATVLPVLHECNHLLAVNKPAGLPSAHFDGVHETADHLAKAYLKERFGKPGNVFLGVVHRLDKPVSGVLLFAKTSKAAARLGEQFRLGMVEKIYWALVDGDPPAAGTLDDYLLETDGRVSVVDADTAGAKRARLHYSTLAVAHGLTRLEVRPQTGRKHQIRIQLASRRWPIAGDFQYGSERIRRTPGIALHARRLTVLHPITREPLTLEADPPLGWG